MRMLGIAGILMSPSKLLILPLDFYLHRVTIKESLARVHRAYTSIRPCNHIKNRAPLHLYQKCVNYATFHGIFHENDTHSGICSIDTLHIEVYNIISF